MPPTAAEDTPPLGKKLWRALHRRIAQRVTPKLPGTSLTWGPPRGYCATAAEWHQNGGAAQGARFDPVYPATSFDRVPARSVEASPPRVFQPGVVIPTETAPMGVHVIPGGRVVGTEAAIVTPDDQVLLDLSLQFGPYHHEVFRRWRLPRCQEIDGPVLVLAGRPGGNYGHWLHQMLPRIRLAERAGWKNSAWKAIIINPAPNGFTEESVALAGLPRDKCVPCCAALHLRGAPLVVPDIPYAGNYPRWVVDYLRKTFADGPGPPRRRRLYASRQLARWRKLANEAAILPVLREFGFEIIQAETLGFLEAIEPFREAEAVFGLHGANLANICFCAPGAKFIQVVAPAYPEIYYWNLASISALEYYYLLGEGPRMDFAALRPRHPSNHEDLTVDPEKLRATFLAAGLEPRSANP